MRSGDDALLIDASQDRGRPTVSRRRVLHAGAGAIGALVAGRPGVGGRTTSVEATQQDVTGPYVLTNSVYSVVAQGTSAMPTDVLAWRFVQDTALPPPDAPSLERALGFVIALGGPMAVVDESGVELWLQTEEAAYVPEAAMQRHLSFADGPLEY